MWKRLSKHVNEQGNSCKYPVNRGRRANEKRTAGLSAFLGVKNEKRKYIKLYETGVGCLFRPSGSDAEQLPCRRNSNRKSRIGRFVLFLWYLLYRSIMKKSAPHHEMILNIMWINCNGQKKRGGRWAAPDVWKKMKGKDWKRSTLMRQPYCARRHRKIYTKKPNGRPFGFSIEGVMKKRKEISKL